MNKKKNIKIIIILISFLVLILVVFFVYKIFTDDNNQVLKSENFEITDSQVSINSKTEDELDTTKLVEINKEEKDIFLNVLGKEYSTYLNEGESVYDIMNRLKIEKGFSFGGYKYPGLGFFVESLSGFSHGDGKYWIYYVNNVEAQVGVSNYTLKKGDIISWRLE